MTDRWSGRLLARGVNAHRFRRVGQTLNLGADSVIVQPCRAPCFDEFDCIATSGQVGQVQNLDGRRGVQLAK